MPQKDVPRILKPFLDLHLGYSSDLDKLSTFQHIEYPLGQTDTIMIGLELNYSISKPPLRAQLSPKWGCLWDRRKETRLSLSRS